MAAAIGKEGRVAVVGLGNMGVPIAERLIDAGFTLAVYNRTAERARSLADRGAVVLTSPQDAFGYAETCITMLADDAALEAVVLADGGVLNGSEPGSLLIDMSTVSVDVSRRVAQRAADVGVAYLRAPVSGNPSVVRAGNLTIIVSGPAGAADRADATLRAVGPRVLYVGEDERARVVKLALGILIGGTAELLAEALVLGEAAGIDRRRLLEVIGASSIGSPFIAYKTEPLLRDDYSATFTTALMLKDVDLVLDLARETPLELPFAERLQALLDEAIRGGYGDLDFMALHLQLQRHVSRISTPNRAR